MQLFTATFVKNKCKFLRFLVQQKLALMITKTAFESIQSKIFRFFSWLANGMLSYLYIIKQRKEFAKK